MAKTFVIGDIHGAYKALIQCLERSGFDRANDHLIALGDLVDVYPDVKECIDELLALPYCDHILGNHDVWAMEWSLRGVKSSTWLEQGGQATIRAYGEKAMFKNHFEFLNDSKLWLELENMLFVHAGFDPKLPIKDQRMRKLTSDRSLVEEAWRMTCAHKKFKIGPYEDIFLGHTPTQDYFSDTPLRLGNIWMMLCR